MAGLLNNRGTTKTSNSNQVRIPKDRFIIGSSETYFESAQYLTGKLSAEKVKSLFSNEHTTVEETEGKSLKVMFRTGTEVKFIGFVTAGDASLELDSDDVAVVMNHATTEDIVKAIDPDSLVAMF